MPKAEATAPLLDASVGLSMVVLVMRRLLAAVTDSDAPFGAWLVWNVVSRIATSTGPVVAIAPPLPAETRKS